MIPGDNILDMALSVIQPQTLQYIQIDRVKNNAGLWVDIPADPVTITGSFQPVPRNLYQQYGLNFNQEYCRKILST
jgi:hypothetical protein